MSYSQFRVITSTPRIPYSTIISKQVEIDFGPIGIGEKQFSFPDSDLTNQSVISAFQVYQPQTTKDLDENEMDMLHLLFRISGQNIIFFVQSLTGSVHGKFKINYRIFR